MQADHLSLFVLRVFRVFCVFFWGVGGGGVGLANRSHNANR